APTLANSGAINPATGGSVGGASVIITGTSFAPGAAVRFGPCGTGQVAPICGTAGTGTAVNGAGTSITTTTPAYAIGTNTSVAVDVWVINPDGQYAMLHGGFLYTF